MLTEIRLHGHLGDTIGKIWKAQISSVSEGLRAIEINSKHKFFKYLIDKNKEGAKYQVLINGRDFERGEYTEKEPISITKSELAILNKNIKTIDIVPIIEGNDDTLNIVLGILLIIAAVALGPAGIGVFQASTALAIGAIGVGLTFAGIAGLLAQPPKFEDFREGRKGGYLFNGPENTVGEGGPVPIIYGRIIVGSLAVAASYRTINYTDQGEILQSYNTPTFYQSEPAASENAIIEGIGS